MSDDNLKLLPSSLRNLLKVYDVGVMGEPR